MLALRCEPTLPLVKILFLVHGRDFILSLVYESTIQDPHGGILLQLSNLLIRLLNPHLHIYQLLHLLLCRGHYRLLIRMPIQFLWIFGLVVVHYFRLQDRHSRHRYFHCPVSYYLFLCPIDFFPAIPAFIRLVYPLRHCIMYHLLLLLCECFDFDLLNHLCSCFPPVKLRVPKLFSHQQHLHQFVKIHFLILTIEIVLHAKQLSLLIVGFYLSFE